MSILELSKENIQLYKDFHLKIQVLEPYLDYCLDLLLIVCSYASPGKKIGITIVRPDQVFNLKAERNLYIKALNQQLYQLWGRANVLECKEEVEKALDYAPTAEEIVYHLEMSDEERCVDISILFDDWVTELKVRKFNLTDFCNKTKFSPIPAFILSKKIDQPIVEPERN